MVKREKTIRVTLGGKPWRLRTAAKPMKDWGYADFADKEIVICPTAERHQVYRETLIHEMIHALFPVLDEDVVKAAAIEIDDALEVAGV